MVVGKKLILLIPELVPVDVSGDRFSGAGCGNKSPASARDLTAKHPSSASFLSLYVGLHPGRSPRYILFLTM